jgi:hypothetical protein
MSDHLNGCYISDSHWATDYRMSLETNPTLKSLAHEAAEKSIEGSDRGKFFVVKLLEMLEARK